MNPFFNSISSAIICLLFLVTDLSYAQTNETKYIPNETYKTTGQPKVDRSEKAKKEFLKSKGYSQEPKGYQVDHIKPLSQGGKDEPSNMQLITVEEHKAKTARERKQVSETNHISHNKNTTSPSSKPATYNYSEPKPANSSPKPVKYNYTAPKSSNNSYKPAPSYYSTPKSSNSSPKPVNYNYSAPKSNSSYKPATSNYSTPRSYNSNRSYSSGGGRRK